VAAIDQGCWSRRQTFGDDSADWCYSLIAQDGSQFEVTNNTTGEWGRVNWSHGGTHNVCNAVAAIIAAHQVGVSLEKSCEALSDFVGVKRRMEVIYRASGLTIYDDFAHHPTAIQTTLEGLRARVGDSQIIAVIEPRSATMRLGMHKDRLSACVAAADQVFWYQNPRIDWDIQAIAKACPVPAEATADIQHLLALTIDKASDKTHIVIMSNGGFEGFHLRLIEALQA
jgi:UDP-N-acetylmuramate: L-alanyl-gamma-D-glutamyl-meso-diaminopimelate ligase